MSLVLVVYQVIVTAFSFALDPSRFSLVRMEDVLNVLDLLLLIAVAAFHLSVWFAGVPQLGRPACHEAGFFFAKIRLNENALK